MIYYIHITVSFISLLLVCCLYFLFRSRSYLYICTLFFSSEKLEHYKHFPLRLIKETSILNHNLYSFTSFCQVLHIRDIKCNDLWAVNCGQSEFRKEFHVFNLLL